MNELAAGNSTQTSIRKWSKLALKLAVGTAILAWLMRTGRFDIRVYSTLVSHGTSLFLLGVLLAQASRMLLQCLRWWILLRALGIPMSLLEATKVSMKGLFTNLLIPGGFGLDGLRVLHLHKYHRHQWAHGVSSAMMDRTIGVQALLVLGTVGAFFVLVRHPQPVLWTIFMVNVLFAGLLAFVVLVSFTDLGQRMIAPWRRFRRVERGLSALRDYRHQPAALAAAMTVGLLGQLSVGFAVYFALLALRSPVSLFGVLAATPLVTVAHALPVTPQGLGLSDTAAAVLYPVVGLSHGAEATMLLRVTGSLLLFSCGVAFLQDRRQLVDVCRAETIHE